MKTPAELATRLVRALSDHAGEFAGEALVALLGFTDDEARHAFAYALQRGWVWAKVTPSRESSPFSV